MKRRDELVVGITMLVALAVVVGGALWLSQTRVGGSGAFYNARFRTVGALGVGDPVVLRGIRVGRVSEIRLGADDWVEALVQVYDNVALPPRPAVIAASGSLFGEWQASLISLDQPISDPNIRRDLAEAEAVGGAWPGATLPDIGQLTAQAGRIASDIAGLASQVRTAFDSTAVVQLQESIRDFGRVSDQLASFTQQQTEILGEVGGNLQRGSNILSDAARSLQVSLARVDSATEQGQLTSILINAQVASEEMAVAAKDFRELMGTASSSQESVQRIIEGADSLMTRLQDRMGTIGLLVGDTTLYVETTRAVIQLQELLTDIEANPRKYFKFSVF